MGDFNFRAKEIGLKAQKKILSRMSTKNIAKVFIDDTSSNLLDTFYKLVRIYTGNKKDAEKVVKNIIKIIVKIGVLYRNDQFNREELEMAHKFKRKFNSTTMTFISFVEVEYSFDRNYLIQLLRECQCILKELVCHHLTDKSLTRIDHVFGFFSNPPFLDAIFVRNGPYQETLNKVVQDLHKMMEDGSI